MDVDTVMEGNTYDASQSHLLEPAKPPASPRYQL